MLLKDKVAVVTGAADPSSRRGAPLGRDLLRHHQKWMEPLAPGEVPVVRASVAQAQFNQTRESSGGKG